MKKSKIPRGAPGGETPVDPFAPADSAQPSELDTPAADPAPEPEAAPLDRPMGESAPVPGRPFPIVGIGASAGGLEALEEFFGSVPPDSGMAFVVVTHQHPGHATMLPELLAKTAAIPVHEARDGIRVEPDSVYVGLPGGQLDILDGTLHRLDDDRPEPPHLPIDHFFRSLAQDQKERAVCIVLSGTGTDGTLGLKAIKAENGLAMAQRVESAKYAGMPSSALATGLVDYAVPPAEMAGRLLDFIRGPYQSARGGQLAQEGAAAVPPEPLQKIFVLLRSRTGHDFSSYKPNTIHRRIERRMNLHQIAGPAQYVRYLQENPHEIDILFKELLIGVTSFFRDPEAFQVLGDRLLPALLASRPDNHAMRAWVPGCATGEEVYSLAILLREVIERVKRPFDVQIFGTDLDRAAIDSARLGQYPEGIAADLEPGRLERWFVREDSGYRVRKEIREMAIFAVQNVIQDPPFTKLDLIVCRNLLIYLNGDLQGKLLPLFHYALRPGGLLFLGPAESIGSCSELFDSLDKKWKIFRRKDPPAGTPTLVEFPVNTPRGQAQPRQAAAVPSHREQNVSSLVERLLLQRFAPASLVVNEVGDVVFIHGRTGAYLEPAPGQPRLNAFEMAREGLQLDLVSAVREANRSGDAFHEGVRVRTNGDFAQVDLSVVRIAEPEALRGLLLVTFRPRATPAEPPPDKGRSGRPREPGRVQTLERELQYIKESLQTTIEELETSNEELKSTNEELQSTNEELQSANEELETSKEEMQSLNEELTTVNAELHSKVEELSRANDDMQNLLNSTEIATIFLDRELNIKRYTEQARRLVNLIQSDVGRPLADLVSNLRYDRLVDDCREVLRTLVFKLSEVQTRDGGWYLMRIMPYRTAENVIDGLVLTFVDIDPVKRAEGELEQAKGYLADSLLAMTRLHEIDVLFRHGANLEDMMAQALDAAMGVTGADLGIVQIAREPGGPLRPVTRRGEQGPWLGAWEALAQPVGGARAMLSATEPTLVEDLAASPLLSAYPVLGALLDAGIAAFQSTPVLGPEGRLLGRISTLSRSPGRSEERSLQLLGLLGRQAAGILEAARNGAAPPVGGGS